ncbi:protein of unknown function [Candidatus Nitrosocosmicus franklandus]|uniref:Uncharacterized protein n=1 Tax=Candidatus Nitrosocosmicus franklandianus TaxID=1798806 RepID=A0A484I3Y3_9ARCH|nr:protein of unknown function [Candidatus Nitrosocosmicus franklandus]
MMKLTKTKSLFGNSTSQIYKNTIFINLKDNDFFVRIINMNLRLFDRQYLSLFVVVFCTFSC